MKSASAWVASAGMARRQNSWGSSVKKFRYQKGTLHGSPVVWAQVTGAAYGDRVWLDLTTDRGATWTQCGPFPASGSEVLLLATERGRFVGKHDKDKDDDDPQKKDGFWGRVPPEGTPGKHGKDEEEEDDDEDDEDE